MSEQSAPSKKFEIDKPMFIGIIAAILLIAVPIIGFNKTAAPFIIEMYDSVTSKAGFLYIWYGAIVMVFIIWLASSKYGNIRLGGDKDSIEFSKLSWIGMLFSAGVGAGLLYWAVIEWGYYLEGPPYRMEAGSPEAAEWSAAYGLFHWGPSAWAIYALPTVAIAYAFYVRKIPYLRLSAAVARFLPSGINSTGGRIIDFLFMINLIGGTGTSLGLSAPMIAGGVAKIVGVTHDFALEVVVVVLSILIFSTSAFLGLKKGIKRLSDLNVYMAFALLFFVLALGPTVFILKSGTNSFGLVLQNFIRMSLWTDPIDQTHFVEDWTVFYWAWWIAYAPFVGIFVTRISRGRTIKQVISGMLIFGSLGAWIFFIILGNHAMHLNMNGLLEISTKLNVGSKTTAAVISDVFLALPFGQIALIIFILIAFIFLATTYDSASFSLASVSTKNLKAGESPSKWNSVFWAFGLAILPISLLFVDGGIKVVLSTTVLVSLPLLFVGFIMMRSLYLMLKEDEP